LKVDRADERVNEECTMRRRFGGVLVLAVAIGSLPGFAEAERISAPGRVEAEPGNAARMSAPLPARFAQAAPGRPVAAGTRTVTASHTYIIGDNDSRNDARQLCFLEAKKKVLDQAGTFIQSQAEVTNFQLTRNQITAYSAAVLAVDTVGETFSSQGGSSTLTCTVRAEIDVADVRQRFAAIAGDRSVQDRIAGQQEQIRGLETQLQQLNARLNAAPAAGSGELRKDRNIVFGNLQELESRRLAALQAIQSATQIVMRFVEKGMTKAEVESIAGKPRGASWYTWSFGEVWVVFNNVELVECVSKVGIYPHIYAASNCSTDNRLKPK
jgi:hypothetical protein